MEYLDFELEIKAGKGRRYPIEVISSPAGETAGFLKFPFDQLTLENRLQALEIALLTSSTGRRRIAGRDEQAVQDFGAALFDSLFTGETKSLFDTSRHVARQQHKGLRLKIRCESPLMASMPWEFLYDQRDANFLCLSKTTPVVRYLEMKGPMEALKVTPPLRILAMIASPNDLPGLDVEKERERIDRATQTLQQEGLLELHWLEGQTWRHLQQALWKGEWHVFHFIGHGGFDENRGEGLIAMTDDEGRLRKVFANDLGMLLGDHSTLRLAILNSCEGARGDKHDVFSSTASVLVRRGTPGVVAMQYEISDLAAVELARSFYEALAMGIPVDSALGAARQAVRLALDDTLEWGTPVLFMRSPDGVLFDVDSDLVAKPRAGPKAPTERALTPSPEPGLRTPSDTTPGIKPLSWGDISTTIGKKLTDASRLTDFGKKIKEKAANASQAARPANVATSKNSREIAKPTAIRPPQEPGRVHGPQAPTQPAEKDQPANKKAFCRKCGTQGKQGAKFCNRCGANY